MPAPPPPLWLWDPDGRWPEVSPLAGASAADAAARLMDGRSPGRSMALAEDEHPAPVVALVEDEAGALAALAAGFDAALTRAELAAGRLPIVLRRAEALRRARQQRQRRRAAELGAADATLETIGRSISHDLRAPLRALDGFGQALVEDFADELDPQALKYIDRIRAATVRLDERIIALTRLTQAVRRPFEGARVDLGQLADEVVEHLRASAPARSVVWRRDPELTVPGDRRLLTALVGELISNAWRFSAGRAPARIELRRLGGGFVVRDDGAGFGQSYAETIFQAFARFHTEDEFPGAGVGLAVARCAVERHGGRIVARGVEGVGAAFAFTLDPAADPPALDDAALRPGLGAEESR